MLTTINNKKNWKIEDFSLYVSVGLPLSANVREDLKWMEIYCGWVRFYMCVYGCAIVREYIQCQIL